MCFQGFVYFLCGHDRIIAQTCELAEDNPFYLKVACPNYRSDSSHPGQYCGLGKYYCKGAADGAYLEQLHQTYYEAQMKLQRYNSQLEQARVHAMQLNEACDQRDMPLVARQQLPAWQGISYLGFEAVHRGQEARQTIQRCQIIITRAMEHCRRREQLHAGGAEGAFPPLLLPPEISPRIPGELTVQMSEQDFAPPPNGMPGQEFNPAQSMNVSDHGPRMHGNQQQAQLERSPGNSEGSTILAVPRQRPLGHHLSGLAQQMLEKQRADSYRRTGVAPAFSAPPKLPAPKAPKSACRKRRLVGQDTPTQVPTPPSKTKADRKDRLKSEVPTDVRRSTRVRDKKVSYAESVGSSFGSREASPEKSDAWSTSPERSERSLSPEKPLKRRRQQSAEVKMEFEVMRNAELQRKSSSLSSKIADFKRRASSKVDTPSYGSPAKPAESTAYHGSKESSVRREVGHTTTAPTVSGVQEDRRPEITVAHGTRSLEMLREHGVAAGPGGQLRLGLQRQTSPPIMNIGDSSLSTSNGGAYGGHPGLYQSRSDTVSAHPGSLASLLAGPPPSVAQQSLSSQFASYQPAFAPIGAPASYNMPPVMQPAPQRTFGFGSSVNPFPSTPYKNAAKIPSIQGMSSNTVPGITADHNMRLADRLGLGTFQAPQAVQQVPRNYAQLQRSFSATTGLTPPVFDQPTPESTEPLKRSVPASSPVQPKKPMPLSLPGQEVRIGVQASDSPLDNPSMSTKFGMLAYPQHTYHAVQDMVSYPSAIGISESVQNTNASVLAPTAVMDVPPFHVHEDGVDGGDGGEQNQSDVGDEGEHDGLDFGGADEQNQVCVAGIDTQGGIDVGDGDGQDGKNIVGRDSHDGLGVGSRGQKTPFPQTANEPEGAAASSWQLPGDLRGEASGGEMGYFTSDIDWSLLNEEYAEMG